MTAPTPDPYTGGIPNPFDPAQVGGAIRRVAGVIPGASEAAGFLDAAVATRRWISDRHNWVRVGWFVLGAGMIYAGVIVLARHQIAAVASGTEKVGTKVAGDVIKGAIV